MKVQILGGHGGLAKGFATTSYLIDRTLLVDAGAVAQTLSISEQTQIDNILISHCHLDHIKDLAFISDNCFGLKSAPFHVHTHQTVKNIIKAHLLNDIVWPDFTRLPSVKNPTMSIHTIESEKKINIGNYQVTPVSVNHPYNAMGFIVESGDTSVLFTLDTGPTERIWEIARGIKNLKAIFTEVSFPNSLQNVADVSHHHTPQTLKLELPKMPQGIPIILTHLKPSCRDEIFSEVTALGDSRLKILEKDGEIFNF